LFQVLCSGNLSEQGLKPDFALHDLFVGDLLPIKLLVAEVHHKLSE
jgi:hypothetical protein